MKSLIGTSLLASTALTLVPAIASAQSKAADIIFVVDESGSMAGEHTFLQSFATGIETSLGTQGINSKFGLTGYGSSNSAEYLGHGFMLDGSLLGDAAAFSTAATGLVTNGGTEDGYAGIDFALDTYTLTPNASLTIVLVTDEDRDVVDSSIDYASMLGDLNGKGANLVVVVDAEIQTTTGADGISTDGSTVLVQSGSTTSSAAYAAISSNQGNTTEDYVKLALSTANGCVADLNFLRAGGDASSAFAEAFSTCVTSAAVAPNPQNPGNSNAVPVAASQSVLKIVLISHGRVVGTFTPNSTGGGTVTRAAYNSDANMAFADDAFGVAGLEMYFSGSYSFGEFDTQGTNTGFDFSGGSATLGMTYTLPGDTALGQVSLGGAFSYGSITADLADGNSSTIKSDAMIGTLYGLFSQDSGLHGRLDLTYGSFDYTQVRDPAGNVGGPFMSSPGGHAIEVSAELGKELAPMSLGDTAQFVLDPFVGVTWQKRTVDAYTESGGGLSVGEVEASGFTPEIGLRGTLSADSNGGTNFLFAEVAYAREMGDQDYSVAINSTNTLFEGENQNVFKTKLAVGRDMADGLTALLMYEGDFTSVSRAHTVSASLSYKF